MTGVEVGMNGVKYDWSGGRDEWDACINKSIEENKTYNWIP